MKRHHNLNYLIVNHIGAGSRECLSFFKILHFGQKIEEFEFLIPLDSEGGTSLSKILSVKDYIDYESFNVKYLAVLQFKKKRITRNSKFTRLTSREKPMI